MPRPTGSIRSTLYGTIAGIVVLTVVIGAAVIHGGALDRFRNPSLDQWVQATDPLPSEEAEGVTLSQVGECKFLGSGYFTFDLRMANRTSAPISIMVEEHPKLTQPDYSVSYWEHGDWCGEIIATCGFGMPEKTEFVIPPGRSLRFPVSTLSNRQASVMRVEVPFSHTGAKEQEIATLVVVPPGTFERLPIVLLRDN